MKIRIGFGSFTRTIRSPRSSRHYDVRAEEDKMRQRREVLDEILRDGSGDR